MERITTDHLTNFDLNRLNERRFSAASFMEAVLYEASYFKFP
jgi:hypothetical protein